MDSDHVHIHQFIDHFGVDNTTRCPSGLSGWPSLPSSKQNLYVPLPSCDFPLQAKKISQLAYEKLVVESVCKVRTRNNGIGVIQTR